MSVFFKVNAKGNAPLGKSKEEGKDQESIQPSTAPDLRHHMEK